ncbi:hypothetical protein [Paraburkholderia sp. A3RO-2L]|jgi:hypothetical protein|uniref:hypothetical protein n=1 Tax=unclassified Paraburkholderia TaxID=2615204 RepID=UPI003DA87595
MTPTMPDTKVRTPWHLRALDWVACELDKRRSTNALTRNYGRFRVQYSDGQWTEKMSYRAACNYADCFGGDVHWVGRHDPAKIRQ